MSKFNKCSKSQSLVSNILHILLPNSKSNCPSKKSSSSSSHITMATTSLLGEYWFRLASNLPLTPKQARSLLLLAHPDPLVPRLQRPWVLQVPMLLSTMPRTHPLLKGSLMTSKPPARATLSLSKQMSPLSRVASHSSTLLWQNGVALMFSFWSLASWAANPSPMSVRISSMNIFRPTSRLHSSRSSTLFNTLVVRTLAVSWKHNVTFQRFFVLQREDVLSLFQPAWHALLVSSNLTLSNFGKSSSFFESAILPNALSYVASKGAIEQISRVLAKDLGGRGITVNTISPGPVDTPLFTAGKPQQVIDFIAKQNPNNRLGLPEDIAPAIAFVASPAAQWVNGQNICVNGVSDLILSVSVLRTDVVFPRVSLFRFVLWHWGVCRLVSLHCIIILSLCTYRNFCYWSSIASWSSETK